MAEITRMTARCSRSGQAYLLLIENRTVTDVLPAPDNEPQRERIRPMLRLHTADSLRACPVCGSRRIAGCDCLSPLLPCERGMGFRFACVYCKHLRRVEPAENG